MEEYLMNTLYHMVKLRGALGKEQDCMLERCQAYPHGLVLRESWVKFAADNNFKAGQKICFRMVNFHEDQIINVDYC